MLFVVLVLGSSIEVLLLAYGMSVEEVVLVLLFSDTGSASTVAVRFLP